MNAFEAANIIFDNYDRRLKALEEFARNTRGAQEIQDNRIAELEKNQQKPAEPKRKTLGEICYDAFKRMPGKDPYGLAAKAVAEAIIERHLSPQDFIGQSAIDFAITARRGIRKEFE